MTRPADGKREQHAQWEPNEAARPFYEEAGAAAASLGVAVDVYALGEDSFGLDMLEPLPGCSGGALQLYPRIEDAALPEVGLCEHLPQACPCTRVMKR